MGDEETLIPGFSSPGSAEHVGKFQSGDILSATGSSEDCNWISVKNESPVGGCYSSSSICWVDAGMLEPVHFPCMYSIAHSGDTKSSRYIRSVERGWRGCSNILKHFD